MRGRFLSPDGRPLSGNVTFRFQSQLTFPEADIILGGPVVAPLDAQGQIEVTLPATDAPGMDPAGGSITVTEALSGIPAGRSYQLLLPAKHPHVDLADIAPTDPTKPQYVPVEGPRGDRGERGPSAYEVALAEGYVGTRTEWLASLVGPRGATGPQGDRGPAGPVGAPGVIQSVNGFSTAAITLTATHVGAIPAAAAGAAGGVATLGADGRVPAAQLPTTTGGGAVESVNDRTGRVQLDAAAVGAAPATHTHTAAQVGAIATTARGAANGVASLDGAGRLPVAQLPTSVGRNVWTPQALGFQAWTCDPYGVANPTAKYLTPQRLYVCGINITEPTPVNAVIMFSRGYGGVSSNRYAAGIYREDGTKVVGTAAPVSLGMAGQTTGSPPQMINTHVGATPIAMPSTVTLSPGRYWATWVLATGGTADYAYYHVQNEAPVAAANWFFGTPFARAWYLNAQSDTPARLSQGDAGVLTDHDVPIMALALTP